MAGYLLVPSRLRESGVVASERRLVGQVGPIFSENR